MISSQPHDTVKANDAAKVMFEIFREQAGEGPYHVIYYTELNEKNRDAKIEWAMAGEHVYYGFLVKSTLAEGKVEINTILARLNKGESLEETQLDKLLAPYAAL